MTKPETKKNHQPGYNRREVLTGAGSGIVAVGFGTVGLELLAACGGSLSLPDVKRLPRPDLVINNLQRLSEVTVGEPTIPNWLGKIDPADPNSPLHRLADRANTVFAQAQVTPDVPPIIGFWVFSQPNPDPRATDRKREELMGSYPAPAPFLTKIDLSRVSQTGASLEGRVPLQHSLNRTDLPEADVRLFTLTTSTPAQLSLEPRDGDKGQILTARIDKDVLDLSPNKKFGIN